MVILMVLVEEWWGVECEGRCCCGAGRKEQLVYHDAGFGGRRRKGERLCAIAGFWIRSWWRGVRRYMWCEGKAKAFHGFYGCVGR